MPPVGTLPAPSIVPVCPNFYECGGCDLQDVPYKEQLAFKQASLERLFEGIAVENLPIIGSCEEYPVFYRNKIRFSFVRDAAGHVKPSRHRKGGKDGDMPVEECFLQSPESNEWILRTARIADERGWSLYVPSEGGGWLKHLLIRQGKRTGEILLALVTNEGGEGEADFWCKRMGEWFPEITSIWHIVTEGVDNQKFLDRHLFGATHIHERIGEHAFRISPHAFFQTNSAMIESLYDAVGEQVAAAKPSLAWDLYAGSATIGIHVAEYAGKVLCIESDPSNVKDGEANIHENGITNVTMVGGEVEASVGTAFKEHGRPNLVIVDPPRAGLSEKARTLLSGVRPERLVYVSCNPITLLRDVKDLSKRGFKPVSLQGVDMFPQTLHCEAVMELQAT